MLNINIVNLNKNLVNFNKNIKELEIIEYNLYSKIIFACNNDWNDGKSKSFLKSIYEEQKEVVFFIEKLNKLLELFSYVSSEYSMIGKKVNIDFNYKRTNVKKIDNFLEEINNLINYCENCNYDLTAGGKTICDSKIQGLFKISNDIKFYKSSFLNVYEKIDYIEKNVLIKINKIGTETISKNSLTLGELSNVSNTSMLKEDNLLKDIEQINCYIGEEQACFNKILNDLNEIISCYKTENTKKLISIIEEFKTTIDNIYVNKLNYIEILNKVIPLYNSVENNIFMQFEKKD